MSRSDLHIENASGVFVPVSASNPLPTSAISGGGGTQYTDGGAAVPHATGNALIYTDGSNIPRGVSTTNPLPVTGGTAQYADGSTQAGATGTVILWRDASNAVHIPSLAQALPTQLTDGAGNVLGTTTHPVVDNPRILGIYAEGTDSVAVLGGSPSFRAAVGISASTYAAGQCLGTVIHLSNAFRVAGGNAVLQSLFVTELGTGSNGETFAKTPFDLYIWNQVPTETFTDHSNFPQLGISGAVSYSGLVAVISVASTAWLTDTLGGIARATINPIGIPIPAAATTGTDLWVAAQATGAGTYASGGALAIQLGILGN